MGTKALLSVLVLVSFAAAQHPGPAQRAAKRLEGTWVVVSDQEAAVVLGDEYQKGARWVIKDGKIVLAGDRKRKEEHRVCRFYTVNPTRNPAGIEIVWLEPLGCVPLSVQSGVYVLDGDRLRLYLANLNDPQPVRFPRRPKFTQPVLTLQRVRR